MKSSERKLGSSENIRCEQEEAKELGQEEKYMAIAHHHCTGLQRGKEKMEVRVGLSMHRTLKKKIKLGRKQKQRSPGSRKVRGSRDQEGGRSWHEPSLRL